MRFAKLRWPRSLGARLLATYVAGILVCIKEIVVLSGTLTATLPRRRL